MVCGNDLLSTFSEPANRELVLSANCPVPKLSGVYLWYFRSSWRADHWLRRKLRGPPLTLRGDLAGYPEQSPDVTLSHSLSFPGECRGLDPAPNLGRATARDQRARASARGLRAAHYTDQRGRSLAQQLAGSPCSGALARALGPVGAGSRVDAHIFLAAQHPGQRPSPFPFYIETYPCRGAEDGA